ncbi:chorismate--pyruvate lyase [Coxiella burnetii]|uniref:Probable chorismate pyruvate-lyase n=1 Tax=Coxiella burnetii (strain RSA 493 / Nine Mile phase I) TaxID=227377 RepID=UBIC_COXBU|nr:chorismate lyase [Coxiella burnetii]NP_819107.1 chorismate--pyruvate lyase [Coxiella burnetii RSA 493]Q83F94.1 RecName: Full=Probable chorismate pyruvate-lyase; Short=CL; Short=CPL [Coxiella burnetii RSA 493]AAO89621.1 chorismate--pyruvate lyase [Coxiella burnetii RSA 493]ABX77316.1 putative chorismate--pyruvate lyase [Coxiella burnetii RSA 331]AML47981.1 chorismate--pyruvate lyase [Coxiella burnetii]AML54007.1 chorismate--pyruvate lyase [Coxiella burnetii]ARI64980.1 chorismate--pyruvate 
MKKQLFWAPQNEIPSTLWTANERSWLTHPGSLTQRLRKTTDGQIQHHLLREVFDAPVDEETQLLGISQPELALIREIEWRYFESLWVAGRVVIPKKTLEREGSPLNHIGERSLGDILFANAKFTRGDLEFRQITADHPYYFYVKEIANGSCIWARRSLFYFERDPLLVSEIFSPALFLESSVSND